jgi:hypothetical protein
MSTGILSAFSILKEATVKEDIKLLNKLCEQGVRTAAAI